VSPLFRRPHRAPQDGSTPLVSAAFGGSTDIVRYLLAKGADIRQTNGTFGWSALIAAAFGGHASTVALLLEHGADVNVVDSEVRRWGSEAATPVRA
jgi:ankyrin repeat protein